MENNYGFIVSDLRKELWNAQMDILKRFIDICKSNNLKYIVYGGTLLGTIRHDGYIPWDDDIDIMMPREDYEKFLKIGQEYLGDNYFLQSHHTEKSYVYGHAQIRNTNTTCLISSSYTDLSLNKNCGIFIDIFPCDYVPDDYKERMKHTKKIKRLKQLAQNKVYKYNSKNKFKTILKRLAVFGYFLFHDLEKTIIKYNNLAMKYKDTNTVALASFLPCYEKNVWDKKLFEELTTHKFEDMLVSIPVEYDKILTKMYDNYMEIQENNNNTFHWSMYFDVNKSYKDYKNLSKEEVKELIKQFSF